jgi:hypothetical protein
MILSHGLASTQLVHGGDSRVATDSAAGSPNGDSHGATDQADTTVVYAEGAGWFE